MSLASYVVLAIKKSLLSGDFCLRSQSIRTDGRPARLLLPPDSLLRPARPPPGAPDRRCPRRSRSPAATAWGDGGGTVRFEPSTSSRAGLREAAPVRSEARPARITRAGPRGVPDVALDLRQLERPGARARRDVQRPVAGDARRPGVGGDPRPDRVGPDRHDVGDGAAGAEASRARDGRPRPSGPSRLTPPPPRWRRPRA